MKLADFKRIGCTCIKPKYCKIFGSPHPSQSIVWKIKYFEGGIKERFMDL